MRTSIKISLVVGGLFLLFSRLFYDLYCGASDSLQPNIANDVFNHVWPFYNFARASVQSGILPMWNPYSSLGTPFFAEIGLGLFYPLTWIILLTDVPSALVLIQFLTVVIGMAGMYCYTRYLALIQAARFLCVTLFAYAVFTESFFPTMGYSYCLIPSILWLCHRMMDRPVLQNSCYVAVSLALCFLGGFPNSFVYTVLISGIYCAVLLLFSSFDVGLSGIARRVGMALVGLALMLGLVAIQLLPAYELSTLSYRNIESSMAYDPSSFWEVFSLGLLFKNFLQTDLGFLFANDLNKIPAGIFYLGGALLLIPFAFSTGRYRKISFALGGSLVFLCLFILSYQVPALALLQKIPFASSIRVNGRSAGYVQFILIVMIGIGFSALFEQAKKKCENLGKVPVTTWVLLFGVYAIWLAYAAFMANENMWFLFGFIPCVILIMFVMSTESGIAYAVKIGWFLALIIVLDISVHRENRFLVPAFRFDESESVKSAVARIRQNADNYRVIFMEKNLTQAGVLANVGPKYQIHSIDAYMGLTSARWENYIRYMLGPDKFDKLVFGSVLQRFYGYFSRELLRSVLNDPEILELASLRYIFEESTMLETEDPLPRAYAVGHYVSTTTEEESLSAIKEKRFSLRDSVVLENAHPTFPAKTMKRDADSVRIRDYTLNKVVLSTDVRAPSIIVLTDAYYPGWEAFVDGSETAIYRANSLFRAVEVPAGKHTVVFSFRPKSFYLGISITLASAFLIVVFLTRRRSRLASSGQMTAAKI